MSHLSNRYPSLQSKQVFVTGGGSGIGEAVVRAFCAQSADVYFIDIDREASETLVHEISESGHSIPRFECVDVRDIESLQRSVYTAAQAMGGLNVLVNNAARDDRHDFAGVSPEYWDECMDINLRPHLFTMQAAQGHMDGAGSVINMGSISWMRGRPGMVGYTTAKGAISAMTRTMARELGPRGIRVNCVLPGWVFTERQQELWLTHEAQQALLEAQSLKIRIQPDDVVAMVLFLASDDSRSCTGQNFIVDAGIV